MKKKKDPLFYFEGIWIHFGGEMIIKRGVRHQIMPLIVFLLLLEMIANQNKF